MDDGTGLIFLIDVKIIWIIVNLCHVPYMARITVILMILKLA